MKKILCGGATETEKGSSQSQRKRRRGRRSARQGGVSSGYSSAHRRDRLRAQESKARGTGSRYLPRCQFALKGGKGKPWSSMEEVLIAGEGISGFVGFSDNYKILVYLRDHCSMKGNAVFCDFGSGDGRVLCAAKEVSPSLRGVVGIEISNAAAKYSRELIERFSRSPVGGRGDVLDKPKPIKICVVSMDGSRLKDLYCTTHLYSFTTGMVPAVQRHVLRLVRDTKSIRYWVYFTVNSHASVSEMKRFTMDLQRNHKDLILKTGNTRFQKTTRKYLIVKVNAELRELIAKHLPDSFRAPANSTTLSQCVRR